MTSWQSIFVGREREISALMSAWDRAKGGHPNVIVLTAETNLGKTRIAQVFYNRLSGDPSQDPECYWPDLLPHGASNLAVNPDFSSLSGRPPAPIPWLWWGLRWTKPDARNSDESRHCAVLDNVHHLEPHVGSLLAMLRAQEELRKIVLSGANTVLGLIPGIGALSGAKDVIEGIIGLRDARQARESASLPINDQRSQHSRSALERLFSILNHVLGTDAVQPGGLPAILLLDDVHWADAESLKFLQRLLRAAKDGRWKLLVLATHWHREWLECASTSFSEQIDSNAPRSFHQLLRALDSAEANIWTALEVGPLDDLGPIVCSAFPGMSSEQVELMISRSGGNPGLLHEIILYLERSPRLFVDGNKANALTVSGVEQLRRKEFKLHTLIEERLQVLGENLREILGFAGYQGVRFSRALTVEVMSRAAAMLGKVDSAPSQLLATAHVPHAIVQEVPIPDQSEFRQPLFQEICVRYWREDPKSVDHTLTVLDAVLAERITSDRFEELPSSEKLLTATLILAREGAKRRDTPASDSALRASAEIVALAYEEGRTDSMLRAWADFWTLGAGDLPRIAALLSPRRIRRLLWTGNMVEDFSRTASLGEAWLGLARADTQRDSTKSSSLIEPLICLGDILVRLDRLSDAARYYAESLVVARQFIHDCANAAEGLVMLSVSLERSGDLHLRRDQFEQAHACYQESHEIRLRLIRDHGPSAEHLRALSVTLDRNGDLFLRRDLIDQAQSCILGSLEITRQLMRDFGSSPERLADMLVSLGRSGNLYRRRDKLDQAEECFRESLLMARQLIRDFGPSAERIRDLIVALERRGELHLHRDQLDQAEACFQEGLQLVRQLIRDFGHSSERLRDLNVLIGCIGDLYLRRDRFDQAEEYFKESLEIARRIIRDFGPSADRSRVLAVSLDRAGSMNLRRDQPEQARACLQESLDITRQLIRDFGPTGDLLRDLSVSLDRIGNLNVRRDEPEQAHACFQEALEITRQLIRDFGRSAERLRNLAVFLGHSGDLHFSCARLGQAEICFRESLDIARQLIREFGPSIERLRDLSVSLDRCGDLHLSRDELDLAETCFQESLGIARQLMRDFGPSAECLRDLALSLGRSGSKHLHRNQLDQAEACFQEGLQLVRQLIRDFGHSSERLRDLSTILDLNGSVSYRRDHIDQAEAYFQESLKVSRQLIRDFGPSAERLLDLSATLDSAGDLYLSCDRVEEAQSCFQESLDLKRQSICDFGSSADRWRDICVAAARVAGFAKLRGNRELATDCDAEARRALLKFRELCPSSKQVITLERWLRAALGD